MSEPARGREAEEIVQVADLRRGWVAAIVVAVVVIAVAIMVGAGPGPAMHLPAAAHASPDAPADTVEDEPGTKCAPPPPFKSEEALDSLEDCGKPCSACHNEDLLPNPKRRELSTHDDIILRHDEKHRWCLDCHDADDRDKLRLANGATIEYSESHLLCGQCHGDKHRDWRSGIHGRRTGDWNGEKEYMLCVHCHHAHAPAFQPIKPMPAPMRQEDIK